MFASLIALPLLASSVSALPIGNFNFFSPRADSTTTTSNNTGSVAAAWFEGWNSDFTVDKVSWSKYTHVTYSFAVTNPDGSLDLSGSGEQAGLTAFVTAAQKNKVKALVSVGGWTGSMYWSSNVATAQNRTAFVKTLTNFASTNKLDGLDFDWEYPTGGGMACNVVNTADTANYLLFLQELRKANPNLILTAAAGIAPWKDATGSPSADVSGFAKVLTYVAIMNYDEYGQWSATAGPNSALDDSCAPPAAQQGSAMSAVKAWTSAGMPANQLVLGVASYGHAFNVAPSAAFAGTPPAAPSSATVSATMSSAADPSATDASSSSTDYGYTTDASATDAPATTDAPSATDSASAPDATATISDAYANSNVNYRRHDGEDDSGAPAANGTLALFPQYTKWQYAADETPATECGKPAQKDVSYTFAALVEAGYLTNTGAVAAGFASTFDACSQTPFLYDQSKQMLVSYDDARAFAAKGSYIKSAGLLGFAMWEASGDHNDVLLDSIRAAVSGTSPPSTASSSSSLSNSGSASATPTTPVQSSTVTDTPYPSESSHCDGMN